jgi:hypothetical protein
MDLKFWKFSDATKVLKCEASSHSVEESVSDYVRICASAERRERDDSRTGTEVMTARERERGKGKRKGEGRGNDEPSPTQSLKSPDTSLPFSRRIFPKYLDLGGVACVSRIVMRMGAISVVNVASVTGSVFNVGTTNSVKAIFAVVFNWEIEG